MFPYLISHSIGRISHVTRFILHITNHISPITYCLFLTLTLSPVFAGEYHAVKEKTAAQTTEFLACSQCHTMHGTQGNVSMVYGGVAGGNIKLLRHASILELCLYCHSNDQANMCPGPPCPPDVWSGSGGGAVTNPSAGLLCAGGSAIATPPCSVDVRISHTVDANANITVPGSSPAITFSPATGGFTCVNCHNPHGTTAFRNLRNNGTYQGVNFAGVDVSYAMAADATKYVNNAGSALTKYQTGNVTFRLAPASNTVGIQGFCKACHTLFHGAGGDAATVGGTAAGDTGTPWVRHPTMDVSMSEGNTNLHVDGSYWTSALTWRPRYIDTDNSIATTTDTFPFCLSCHRAHGSNRHSNLIFGDPLTCTGGCTSYSGGNGTYMRDTCQQCHNQ